MSRSFIYKFKFIKFFEMLDDLPPTYIMNGIGFMVTGHALYAASTQKTHTIVVKNKYEFCRNGFSELIVVDENNNHYNVNNSFWFWKWNSIEDWNRVEPKQHLHIHYYGWRSPILGLFPNIVRMKQLDMINDDEEFANDHRIVFPDYNKLVKYNIK